MNAPAPLPVVLTRSRSDNARLAARLRADGIPVLLWPATEARLVMPPGGPAALRAALEGADIVAFTSRRGVLAARALLGRALGPLLATRHAAAVGRGTAALLARLGAPPRWVGDGGATALGDALSGEPPSRIVLLRGVEADDAPAPQWRVAGHAVTDVRLYRQVEPPAPPCEERDLGAVTCASPLAARRVLAWHPWAARFPFVAIGETTASALASLGVRDVRVARSPDPDSLREAVLETLAARGLR